MIGVLYSGGWESAFCLIKAQEKFARITLLFFNYGQPYLKQEEAAVYQVMKKFNVPTYTKQIEDVKREGSLFINRNESFIAHAAITCDTIYFGGRNILNILDKYKDSNWQFAKEMEKKYKVEIKMPALLIPKSVVRSVVLANGFLPNEVWSSENYNYD